MCTAIRHRVNPEFIGSSLPRVRRHRVSIVIKVVPVTGAAVLHHRGPINVRLSFPTSAIGMKWAC